MSNESSKQRCPAHCGHDLKHMIHGKCWFGHNLDAGGPEACGHRCPTMAEAQREPELLPCPFCLKAVTARVIKGADYSLVGCVDPKCVGSQISVLPVDWNTRTRPTVEAAPLETLRAELNDAMLLIRANEGQLDEARKVAGHTEEAGEVCTSDCLACCRPVEALIRDLKDARAETFKRGRRIERLEQLDVDTRAGCASEVKALRDTLNAERRAKPPVEAAEIRRQERGRIEAAVNPWILALQKQVRTFIPTADVTSLVDSIIAARDATPTPPKPEEEP